MEQIKREKRALLQAAALIASGIVASGKEADSDQVVAQALALASAVDKAVDEERPPFADDAQAIVTLREAGYEVVSKKDFEVRARKILQRKGLKIVREDKENDSGKNVGQKESGRIQTGKRSQGDQAGTKRSEG